MLFLQLAFAVFLLIYMDMACYFMSSSLRSNRHLLRYSLTGDICFFLLMWSECLCLFPTPASPNSYIEILTSIWITHLTDLSYSVSSISKRSN